MPEIRVALSQINPTVGNLKGNKDLILSELKQAQEAGADIIVIQSTVTTARHISKSEQGLVLSDICRQIGVPIWVGNTVSYGAALELMETGIEGILVGVGPGAICTTRVICGIGVPKGSAIMEVTEGLKGSGIPIIADYSTFLSFKSTCSSSAE